MHDISEMPLELPWCVHAYNCCGQDAGSLHLCQDIGLSVYHTIADKLRCPSWTRRDDSQKGSTRVKLTLTHVWVCFRDKILDSVRITTVHRLEDPFPCFMILIYCNGGISRNSCRLASRSPMSMNISSNAYRIIFSSHNSLGITSCSATRLLMAC